MFKWRMAIIVWIFGGIVVCLLVWYYSAQANDFPPFPQSYDTDYPNGADELLDLSQGGDGYATLRRIIALECNYKDNLCKEERLELARLAAEQGEPMALPYLRIQELEINPQLVEMSQIAEAVCNTTLVDLPEISRRIMSANFPADEFTVSRDGDLIQYEEWEVQESLGSGGSRGLLFATSAVWVILIFDDDELKTMRVMFSMLEMGEQARWDSALEIAREIAGIICPSWEGVGDATFSYLMGAMQSWPPRGIHVEGEEAWLAVFGVIPDIVWFDLYVDPLHQPFQSTFRENFEASSDVFLRGFVSEPDDH